MQLAKVKLESFTNIKTYFNKNIDINEIVASNMVSFGKKGISYFIACKDVKNIRTLCIFVKK